MGWQRLWIAGGIATIGCSEYGVGTKPDTPIPTDTGTPPQTTPPVDTPVDTGTPPPPGCEAFVQPVATWVASPPFADAADPTDGSGMPFWEPSADRSDWVPVTLPDLDIPVGSDRTYVGTFDLAVVPVNFSLRLESDDGIWVWVNGTYVGHWGGDWQQEGCVNENANCLLTTTVPSVDVTAWMMPGTNTIAARVSNPVLNAYFEIIPECIE